MSKSLGNVQKKLLRYFRDHPQGGGKLQYYDTRQKAWINLMDGFKAQMWPEIHGPHRHRYLMKRKGRDKQLYEGSGFHPSRYETGFTPREDNPTGMSHEQFKKAQNRIRVTLHVAIYGLLRRGLLRSSPSFDPEAKHQDFFELYVTEAGRKIML
jgi:hypothetical protein